MTRDECELAINKLAAAHVSPFYARLIAKMAMREANRYLEFSDLFESYREYLAGPQAPGLIADFVACYDRARVGFKAYVVNYLRHNPHAQADPDLDLYAELVASFCEADGVDFLDMTSTLGYAQGLLFARPEKAN